MIDSVLLDRLCEINSNYKTTVNERGLYIFIQRKEFGALNDSIRLIHIIGETNISNGENICYIEKNNPKIIKLIRRKDIETYGNYLVKVTKISSQLLAALAFDNVNKKIDPLLPLNKIYMDRYSYYKVLLNENENENFKFPKKET